MAPNELNRQLTLTPDDHHRLNTLCGQLDENLHLIERHLGVEISNRGNQFQIIGIPSSIDIACQVLKNLYNQTKSVKHIPHQKIMLLIKSTSLENKTEPTKVNYNPITLKFEKKTIKARTPNQQHYIDCIQKHDINFGIGPSGTGKTFLAAACALAALEREEVKRIVLIRPAVEAGESLGFLPGDLSQKVDPYLRPLYDALYEMLGIPKINAMIAKGIIEIAPLAYIRGRTLSDAFVILDEGQNSTKDQMKMFLTRIGFGSRAVISGDVTQTDLPKKMESGLRHAISLLQDVKGIEFTFFKSNDIVRHPIVQKIVEAYEETEGVLI